MSENEEKKEQGKGQENPFSKAIEKFASSDEYHATPRRSFIKGDVSAAQFHIGEDGDIEVNNVDKHGNAVFRDKFGNVKCISHEDLEAGLVPDLKYQEKYKMEQHMTRDGELKGSVSLFQDAFYEHLEDQKKALAGKTMPDKRTLPTGKKFAQSHSLPALQKTNEIREAFDQYGRDRNMLDKLAEGVRQAREREKTEKQGSARAGVKISCGACDKQLDSAQYAFCPYCGAQL